MTDNSFIDNEIILAANNNDYDRTAKLVGEVIKSVPKESIDALITSGVNVVNQVATEHYSVLRDIYLRAIDNEMQLQLSTMKSNDYAYAQFMEIIDGISNKVDFSNSENVDNAIRFINELRKTFEKKLESNDQRSIIKSIRGKIFGR